MNYFDLEAAAENVAERAATGHSDLIDLNSDRGLLINAAGDRDEINPEAVAWITPDGKTIVVTACTEHGEWVEVPVP